jgi:hypothetical protein
VVANAFDDGMDATVADRKTLARYPAEISLAVGSAIESNIADDDTASFEGSFLSPARWPTRYFPSCPRHSLSAGFHLV